MPMLPRISPRWGTVSTDEGILKSPQHLYPQSIILVLLRCQNPIPEIQTKRRASPRITMLQLEKRYIIAICHNNKSGKR